MQEVKRGKLQSAVSEDDDGGRGIIRYSGPGRVGSGLYSAYCCDRSVSASGDSARAHTQCEKTGKHFTLGL